MKRIIAAVLCAALMSVLSGCFMRSADELYALPKQAEDYYNLQQRIDEVMVDAAYAAPTGGDNRQSVQMKDLDGDGTNEAIVFAKTEGDLPLKIHVFRRTASAFSEIACFEGDGTSFDSVQYAQIDGREGLEVVVSRQLSEGVPQMVSVYGFVESNMTELYSGSFRQMRLLDMDNDGTNELFVLRDEPSKREAQASLYRWQNGQLLSAGTADASGPADKLIRLQEGKTVDGITALFVTQAVDEQQAVTDVFVWKDHTFYNAAARVGDGILLPHPSFMQPTDVDGSGTLSLPRVLNSAENDDYFLTTWYGLRADGTVYSPTLCCHHADGAWYLILDSSWQHELTIACTDTHTFHQTTFSTTDAQSGESVPVLTVYAYYGTDGDSWAAHNGCFELAEKTGVRYYGSIGTSELSQKLDQQLLTEHFHMQKESAE